MNHSWKPPAQKQSKKKYSLIMPVVYFEKNENQDERICTKLRLFRSGKHMFECLSAFALECFDTMSFRNYSMIRAAGAAVASNQPLVAKLLEYHQEVENVLNIASRGKRFYRVAHLSRREKSRKAEKMIGGFAIARRDFY